MNRSSCSGNSRTSNYKCETCETSFTVIATINPGYSDYCNVKCPTCEKDLGEIRCDIGSPEYTDIFKFNETLVNVDEDILKLARELYELEMRYLDDIIILTNTSNLFALCQLLLNKEKTWYERDTRYVKMAMQKYNIIDTKNFPIEEKAKIYNKYVNILSNIDKKYSILLHKYININETLVNFGQYKDKTYKQLIEENEDYCMILCIKYSKNSSNDENTNKFIEYYLKTYYYKENLIKYMFKLSMLGIKF